jgi:hypothetical protein
VCHIGDTQVIAVLVVVAWVSFWSGLFFWIMKKVGEGRHKKKGLPVVTEAETYLQSTFQLSLPSQFASASASFALVH